MAEGSDPECGGFHVTFLDTSQLERECPICRLAFRDPVQTTCGHRFCKTCMEKVIRVHSRCPLDNTIIPRNQELFQDNAFLKETLNPSRIKCSNGCEWIGNYQYFVNNDHFSKCGFAVTKCPNEDCKETFLRHFLEQHKSECPWEKNKCIYCGDDVIRKDNQSHEEHCIQFPVQCTKCLCKEIPRQMLKEHIDNECVKTKITCPYLPSGCVFIVERDMMEEHVKEQVNKHLLLVQNKSTQDYQQIIQNHQQIAETHKKEIRQAREEIEILKSQKNDQQEQIVEQLWNLVSDEECRESVAKFWEIPGITDKLETSQELTSDTFYTEPEDSGYRFRLNLDLRNFTEDEASLNKPFIGLTFQLCSGVNDDALTWPFKHEFTFTIVNQAGKSDLQHTINAEKAPENIIKFRFSKPIKSKPNQAYGYRFHISIRELRTEGFIRNDHLLIKFKLTSIRCRCTHH